MTHQQILDKLNRHLSKSMEDDFKRLVFYAMCFEKGNHANQKAYILPKLQRRWDCLLNEPSFSDTAKQIAILTMAVLLHKYGFEDSEITKKALKAVDSLNEVVVLSDAFYHQRNAIKIMISSKPTPLKRKPSIPDNITFYRAKDLISIQLEGKFYAAYIHELTGVNESPVIEFYDKIFDKIPSLKDVENLIAKGKTYNDSEGEFIARFDISGLTYQPDLANQVVIIATNIEQKPAAKHLKNPIGLYTGSDLFSIQDTIQEMFHS
jgi:hypothetical protein